MIKTEMTIKINGEIVAMIDCPPKVAQEVLEFYFSHFDEEIIDQQIEEVYKEEKEANKEQARKEIRRIIQQIRKTKQEGRER